MLMHMQYSELKDQSVPQLRALLAQQQEQLRELNFRNASRQLKNVHELTATRKLIAQIKTELTVRKKNDTATVAA